MKNLSAITPYVGDYMTYLYDGSSNEQLRIGSAYAIHLFTDGPGKIQIDGKTHSIDRRTLIFLRPGQPHAFQISRSHPLSSYNLYFDLWDDQNPASLNRSFIYAPEPFEFERMAKVEECPELDQLPSVFSLQPYPHLYDGFVLIAKLYNEARYHRNEAINSSLYTWFLTWFNVLHSHQPSDFRIVRLLDYLISHPERGDSIDEWAEMCGLKRTYFHELFLRETGLTPKVYHHNLIMKRAANLLLESDLSITAIAEKLGYATIHPFTRHFHEHYGISPRQYRLNPQTRV